MKRILKIAASVVCSVGLLYLGLVVYVALRGSGSPSYMDYRYNALITRSLAKLGYVAAQYKMGMFYTLPLEWDEELTDEELERAIYWFGRAAEQGHMEAQYELGNCYQLKREDKNAVFWWNKAAEQGLTLAELALKTRMIGRLINETNILDLVTDTHAAFIKSWKGKLPALLLSPQKNMEYSREQVLFTLREFEAQINFDSLFFAHFQCKPKDHYTLFCYKGAVIRELYFDYWCNKCEIDSLRNIALAMSGERDKDNSFWDAMQRFYYQDWRPVILAWFDESYYDDEDEYIDGVGYKEEIRNREKIAYKVYEKNKKLFDAYVESCKELYEKSFIKFFCAYGGGFQYSYYALQIRLMEEIEEHN